MKIAYFILNRFDTDSRARLEVETLAAMGHHLEIIATDEADSQSYRGFPIHRVAQWHKPWRKIRFVQYNLLAARIARKLDIDIFHAVDLDTLQAAFWASGGRKPVVYEARELYTELEALAGRAAVRNFWQVLERRLIGRAARVITINDSIADELSRRYQISRPVVIRNVAQLPAKLNSLDIRAAFNIPANDKILVYQGILRSGQGLIYLLDILRQLNNTTLLLIGDGPLSQSLKMRCAALNISDKVKFAGMIAPDQLADYTSACDLGLLLMEDVALNNRLALPQKPFQYMACGVPQVVSPMPEIKKLIEENGTGLIVPLYEAPSAARMIAELLSDQHRLDCMAENCHKAAQIHNWEDESRKLKDIYLSLEPSR